MPSITLTFAAPLNTSCQVGDIAHYVQTTPSGGFTVNSSSVVEIGQIRQITPWNGSQSQIICDTEIGGQGIHGTSRFILFSKDNRANLSSVLGYYANVELYNDSTNGAELFSLTMDAFESSK